AGEQDRGDTDENLATPEVVRERPGEDGRQYTPRGTDQGQQRNGGSCLFSAQFDVVRKDVQQVAAGHDVVSQVQQEAAGESPEEIGMTAWVDPVGGQQRTRAQWWGRGGGARPVGVR